MMFQTTLRPLLRPLATLLLLACGGAASAETSAGAAGPAAAGACIHHPALAGAAAKRVAVIVGEGAYRDGLPALPNPANDAAATARAFASLGFETYEVVDGDSAALQRCLADAEAGLAGAAVAAFYYSGHGIQIADENYLVATDAVKGDLRSGFVAVQPIVDALQAKARATLVLLDACRNNPLAQDGRAGLSVSTGRGLARVKGDAALPPGAAPMPATTPAVVQPRGLMVAYSTSPNAVALDGTGTLSPFTAAFVKTIGTSGYSIQRVMSDVTRSVGEATDWAQTPWMKSSLDEELKLGGGQTLGDAQSVSDNHAARSSTLLDTDGRRDAAIVEALKGLPAAPDDAALQRFGKSYLALYSAMQSREVMLPIETGMNTVAVSTADRVAVFHRSPDMVSGRFSLWSVSERKVVAEPPVGRSADAFSFSPHGKLLAVVTGSGTLVLDGLTGAKLMEVRGGRASKAEFSPDETRLLLTDGDGIRVIDLATGKPLATVRSGALRGGAGHGRRGGYLAQATFSGNGAVCFILSSETGGGGTIGVYDLAAKSSRVRDTDEAVTVMVCDPAGKHMVRTFAIGSSRQGMEVWDLAADRVQAVTAPIVNILGVDPKGDYVSVLAFDQAAQGFYDLAKVAKGHPPTVPDGYSVLGARIRNMSGGLVSQDISPNAWRDWPDETLYGPALVKKALAGLSEAQRAEIASQRITYAEVAGSP